MPATAEVINVRLTPDTVAALLADAREHGLDPATIVEDLLVQKYATRSNREIESENSDEFWDAMTEAEKQAEIRAVEEGIADCEAGRIVTMEQMIENARTKFGIELAMPHAAF